MMLIPRCSASPERGRICASRSSGNANARPVGMSARPSGGNVMDGPALRRSTAADPSVAYAGSVQSAGKFSSLLMGTRIVSIDGLENLLNFGVLQAERIGYPRIRHLAVHDVEPERQRVVLLA